MKGLFKRNGSSIYYFRFTPAPGQKQEKFCTGETEYDKAVVKAIAYKNSTRIEKAHDIGSPLAEIDRYIAEKKKEDLSKASLNTRYYVLKSFVENSAKATKLSQITKAEVQKWNDKNHEKLTPSSAAAYLRILDLWFKWMISKGLVKKNPTESIPKISKKKAKGIRRRFLTKAECDKLLYSTDNKTLKFIIYCGLHLGMRKNEIVEARPNWFDLDKGLVHLQKTETFDLKDGENRTVPMTEEFKDWIKNHYKIEGDYMIKPKIKMGRGRYRYEFRKLYIDHVAACGIKDITFHDLRRTFASRLVSNGVSIFKVAKWLGDGMEVVQAHYGHLEPQDSDINRAWM